MIGGQVISLARLPEVFPDQVGAMAQACLAGGQTTLAGLFMPNRECGSGSSNLLASGSPLLTLYRARRLYTGEASERRREEIVLEAANSFRRSKLPTLL